MDTEKKIKLERAGWKVGSTEDFLGLSEEEIQVIDIKYKLGKFLRELRTQSGLTQKEVAEKTKTTQPRIAMMEKCDPGISLDALIQTLFALNAEREKIGDAFKNDNNLMPA